MEKIYFKWFVPFNVILVTIKEWVNKAKCINSTSIETNYIVVTIHGNLVAYNSNNYE